MSHGNLDSKITIYGEMSVTEANFFQKRKKRKNLFCMEFFLSNVQFKYNSIFSHTYQKSKIPKTWFWLQDTSIECGKNILKYKQEERMERGWGQDVKNIADLYFLFFFYTLPHLAISLNLLVVFWCQFFSMNVRLFCFSFNSKSPKKRSARWCVRQRYC
jgi:hypothetical protein